MTTYIPNLSVELKKGWNLVSFGNYNFEFNLNDFEILDTPMNGGSSQYYNNNTTYSNGKIDSPVGWVADIKYLKINLLVENQDEIFYTIDLLNESNIKGIRMYPREDYKSQFVTKYKVQISLDNQTWSTVNNSSGNEIFENNYAELYCDIDFDEIKLAKYVKINVIEYFSHPAFKVGVIKESSIIQKIFELNSNQYNETKMIRPGKGYWIKSSKNYTINLKNNLTLLNEISSDASNDTWYYHNPKKDKNLYFLFQLRDFKKINIWNFNILNKNLTKCSINKDPEIELIDEWQDIKIYYGPQDKDYAYHVSESNIDMIYVYDLSNLISDNTFSLVSQVPSSSYHNCHVFQNESYAYLYCVGGKINALDIYDLKIDPSRPSYIGGYHKLPNNFVHSHSSNSMNNPSITTGELYIHDIQVIDNLKNYEGKLIAFCSCIDYHNLVIMDVTDPTNVIQVMNVADPSFSKDDFGNPNSYGLHQSWIPPNDRTLMVLNIEMGTSKIFIFDIEQAFEDNYFNRTDVDFSIQSQYIGFVNVTRDINYKYIHNCYCYAHPLDLNKFLIIVAGYNEGTSIWEVDINKVKKILRDEKKNDLTDGIQKIAFYDKNLNFEDDFGGSWSSLGLPKTNYIIESAYENFQVGYRLLELDTLLDFEFGCETFPIPWETNLINDSFKITILKDPGMVGNYRLYVNTPINEVIPIVSDDSINFGNYKLKLYIDNIFKTYMFSNWYDIGKIMNNSGESKEVNIKVELINNENEIINEDNVNIMVPNQMSMMNMKPANQETDINYEINISNYSLIDYNLLVKIDIDNNFEFRPDLVTLKHIEKYGHMHIYKNGTKIGRVVSNYYYLSNVESGDSIRFELSANSHSPYSYDGSIIDYNLDL